MLISKEQIEHLAKLAKLDVTAVEKSRYAEQISSILVYFKQLDEIDLSKVDNMEHITDLKNVKRDDDVCNIYSAEELLESAPSVEDRHVKVKSVFNQE
jgi:aspartyl-tRNA(Asn)/glutamyl-tRNA(Gln) amidotransferase subunit C